MGARTSVDMWEPTHCSLVLHEMKVTLRKDAGAADTSSIPVTLEGFFHLCVLVTGKEGASFWRLLFVKNCSLAQCIGTQKQPKCEVHIENKTNGSSWDLWPRSLLGRILFRQVDGNDFIKDVKRAWAAWVNPFHWELRSMALLPLSLLWFMKESWALMPFMKDGGCLLKKSYGGLFWPFWCLTFLWDVH